MLAASSIQRHGRPPPRGSDRNPAGNYYDADADDRWTDPNLTEPKLQDAFDRFRHHPRPRPRAARGSKSHHQEEQQQEEEELAQIRYFKYIPYRGMSEPDRRKYLSLGTARLTSSRTEPAVRRTTANKQQHEEDSASAAAAFWQSGSKAKSLKVYDYHLAELSMAYRCPPSLLGQPRRFTPPLTQQRQSRQQREQAAEERKSLFYQLHSGRRLPATAPSATQQQLMKSNDVARAEKTTQVSRGSTPFIESGQSGDYQHPPEPRDILSKSASNRLLNVVSVDECHVRHRRRRRRLRRVRKDDEEAAKPRDDAEDGDGHDGGEEEEGEEEDEDVDWDDDGDAVDLEKQMQQQQLDLKQQTDSPHDDQREPSPAPPAPAAEAAAPMPVVPAVATRPATERSSKKSKRRSEQEMRRLASAKFLRRNEILREKLSIYLDWKLDRERFGREVAGCGGCSGDWRLLAELRNGDAATRFERFTVELVHQEALVANQYRGGGGGGGGVVVERDDGAAAHGEAEDEASEPMTHHHDGQQQQQQQHQQHASSPSAAQVAAEKETGDRRAELSLTELFEVLNV